MKEFLKYCLKRLMRFVLKIFWIFPIDNNHIFFMSTMGKSYSCNPKYLYESMIKDCRFEHFFLIWCFNQAENQNVPNNGNLLIISKKNIFKYFYYLLTSKVVIYNCGGFSYAPIRKEQLLIETWHGGGAYKKFDCSLETKNYFSKLGVEMASRDIKLFLSSSALSSEYIIRESMCYKGEILKCGFPRNDILLKDKAESEKWKKKFGINGKKVVLYAPTFKGTENKAENINEKCEIILVSQVKDSLGKKFGGEWIFITRGHQYADQIALEGADLDLTQYPDMQQILLATDVLITDYSSSIWDFALLGRPCFLFASDYESYVNLERGFLTPIEQWPGIIARNNLELSEKIVSFNIEQYEKKIKEYFLKSGSYEQGVACELTKDFILNIATNTK